MGEAKRRQLMPGSVLYHHTSTLRTNQIWMAGKILPEGALPPVYHPHLGELHTNATFRRAMVDFPPVVWLTTRIAIPNCLRTTEMRLVGQDGREVELPVDLPTDTVAFADQLALNRFAVGFPRSALNVTRWPDHPGYVTAEGRELNESARQAGDEPRDWYVSAEAIDVLLASEVWFARTRANPRLTREDWYLADMRRMVESCRSNPQIFIPPSWLTPAQAKALAAKMGVPIAG